MTTLGVPRYGYLAAVTRSAKLLLLFAIAYPIPFMFQALDWTDQGYWVSNYAGIFKHTSHISSSFTCWLTVVLGGLWLRLTSPLGLLGARLGYVAVMGLSCWTVFATLRRVFAKHDTAIALSLAITSVFVHYDEAGAMNWLNYNDVTGLFFVVAGYLLVRGLDDERWSWVAAGAAVLSLNVLVRLPNAAGLLLGIVVPVHVLISRRGIKQVVWMSLAFAGGLLAGAVLGALLLLMLGHFGLYMAAVRSQVSSMGASQTHSSEQLVAGLVADEVVTIKVGLYLLSLVAMLYGVGRLVAYLPWRGTAIALGIAGGLALYLVGIPIYMPWVRSLISVRWLWSHVGVAYWVLAAMVLLPLPGIRGQPLRRTTALLGLLILLVVPVGSSRSLLNAHYGMWLAGGCVGTWLFTLPRDDRAIAFVQAGCAAGVLIHSLLGLWHMPFRDTRDRTLLTSPVKHPRLRGIYTHAGRARVIDELAGVLPRYLPAGTPVIAFEYIPMIHYLTGTRPYLYNPNPMYYTDSQFREALERALSEDRQLPVIIAARGDVDVDWPEDVAHARSPTLPKFAAMRTMMQEFKTRFRYQLAWENSYFEIWLPGSPFSDG